MADSAETSDGRDRSSSLPGIDVLHRVLGPSDDCIAVFDLSGMLLFISGGGLRTHAFRDHAEARGRTWVSLWGEPDRALAENAFDRAAKGAAERLQGAYLATDGSSGWWDVNLSPVAGEEGPQAAVLAVARDVTDRRREDEHRDLLSRELSHRIQNIFTVINSLIALSARAEPTSAVFAEKLKARLAALWKAHDYVRPRDRNVTVRANSVLGLARILLEAYPADQIHLQGDDLPVSGPAATALALIVHELATNAVKYGALSTSDGRVTMECRRADDRLRIHWREIGGPVVLAPPPQVGFGTTLATRTAAGQLGGVIHYDWQADGLHVVLEMSPTELTR